MVHESAGLTPSEFWKTLEPQLRNDYFALCALDCAYWDYYARKNRRTLRSYFSSEEHKLPVSSYTIGIDQTEAMQDKIRANPWPIYKIKLGTKDDMAVLRALRQVTDAPFRVDVNGAWTAAQTLDFSSELKTFKVEFVEQPLIAGDWEGMKYLKGRFGLSMIADESCCRMEDLDRCSEVFDGINIKLMKCGGLTPAIEMIKRAKELDLKVMAGCMTESTIGISNLVQIAPLLDSIDADGALLLKRDIASGIKLIEGNIEFSAETGSGTRLL